MSKICLVASDFEGICKMRNLCRYFDSHNEGNAAYAPASAGSTFFRYQLSIFSTYVFTSGYISASSSSKKFVDKAPFFNFPFSAVCQIERLFDDSSRFATPNTKSSNQK